MKFHTIASSNLGGLQLGWSGYILDETIQDCFQLNVDLFVCLKNYREKFQCAT